MLMVFGTTENGGNPSCGVRILPSLSVCFSVRNNVFRGEKQFVSQYETDVSHGKTRIFPVKYGNNPHSTRMFTFCSDTRTVFLFIRLIRHGKSASRIIRAAVECAVSAVPQFQLAVAFGAN